MLWLGLPNLVTLLVPWTVKMSKCTFNASVWGLQLKAELMNYFECSRLRRRSSRLPARAPRAPSRRLTAA